MVSIKTLFGYVMYAIAATVVFLYLLFPGPAVSEYLNGRLATVDPSLNLVVAAVRPTIPPGFKLTGVEVNGSDGRLANFDAVRVRPDWKSLWGDEKRIRFRAGLAEGTVDGRATLTGSDPSTQVQVEADLSQIRLELLDALAMDDRFYLTGLLKGKLVYDFSPSAAGTTTGSLSVSGMRIGLESPLFGIGELVMEQTNADFFFDGQTLRLKALVFDGPMLDGKISGSVQLRRPMAQSRLSLGGNAKPQPELIAQLQETVPQGLINTRTLGTRGLNFRIGGTVGIPDVSLR